MIHAILVINNHGEPRIVRFYDDMDFNKRKQAIRACFTQVSKRSDNVCNFLEETKAFGKGVRLIYRHYATLYFVFAVDVAESELGILDLIQVFVEALDKSFENVCELDLIFHTEKVNYILDEIVMGGMVLETNLKEILAAVNGTQLHERLTKSHQRRKSKKLDG